MQKVAAADIVIFGGGIAGLWLLNRLRQSGLSVILFESGALGGGQTQKSQGIIHGGMKYALQGVLTDEAKALAQMPARWKDCLQGKGELDLTGVTVLSHQHYLFSPNKLTAKIAGFLATTALTSKVASLDKSDYPAVFQVPDFKGELYALDEMVLDVTTLVRELVKANQDVIFRAEPVCDEEFQFDEQGNLESVTVYMTGRAMVVSAQQFVFTAGAGNELMVRKCKGQPVLMQRRPLHMVMVKLPFDYPLYAHCMGIGSRPRLTITTHYLQDGSIVWYLGGLLAEEGVNRDADTQINAAQQELVTLFPWLDFQEAQWATLMVDRAEPLQKGYLKPDHAYHKVIQNMIVAWPTKLALAPKLTDDILQHIQSLSLSPDRFDTRELRAWPMPPLAMPVWEEAFCKHS